jgi:hypothetical protein
MEGHATMDANEEGGFLLGETDRKLLFAVVARVFYDIERAAPTGGHGHRV